MRKYLAIVTIGLILGVGSAYAQETTGSIIGTITSQDGAAMPGVTVTIMDETVGFERTTVSNAAGEYKFVALKPGRYDMQAALDGFQTYRRPVEVGLGRTVKNDFVMALGAVTDVIEVTGEAPLVDVTSTVSGISVNMSQFEDKMPISRDATQVALLAPGTMSGDTAFDGRTPGQNLNSIGGTSVAENAYQVNGLNTTNFRNGLGSSFIPMEFVEELQVKTGGYEAEYGRATGGVVNMVTKSGTNSFHGSLNVFFRPESLQEQEPDTYNAYNQQEETEEMEVNASIGGPIVKDHLFFFAFVRYWDRNRLGVATTKATRFEVGQPYYGGKVDWNITANHRLEATYISDEVTTDAQDFAFDPDTGVGDPGFAGEEFRGGENYIGKYTGIFTENFLLSGQYGVNNFDRTDVSEGDGCPYAIESRGGDIGLLGCWVNWSRGAAVDERTAARIDADWYLGRHSLRGGLDSEANNSEDVTEYSGGVYYRYYDASDPTDEFPYEVRVRHYQNAGSFDVNQQAIYVQDSWAINSKMTFNFGVRYEEFENKNSLGETFIKIDGQWAPRLGFVWDPSGQGRNKLFASFGMYYLPIPSNTNVRMAGGELFDQGYFQWTGEMNPDGSPTGYTNCGPLETPNCGNQGSVGDLLDYNIYADGEIPDVREVLSENFDPMSQMEFILGYEQMVGNDWSVGARFVAREYNEVIEDYTIDAAIRATGGIVSHNEYRLGNPGKSFVGWADINNDGELDRVEFSAEELGYPEAERNYYAVELTATKRFSNNWMLDASYTWSHLYGNYEGMVYSDVGQDDAGITQLFDFPALMDNTYGRLPQDRRHNVKIFGAYTFDFGLQLGANATYRRGRPINALGVHPTDPDAQDYGVSSYFQLGVPAPRGNFGNTDDVTFLDLMVKYDFRLGVDWFVRLDVFNVFNQDAVVEVQEQSEQGSSAPPNFVANPNYREPTRYQRPRAVRFGIGLNF